MKTSEKLILTKMKMIRPCQSLPRVAVIRAQQTAATHYILVIIQFSIQYIQQKTHYHEANINTFLITISSISVVNGIQSIKSKDPMSKGNVFK